jgi:hypothetical protein
LDSLPGIIVDTRPWAALMFIPGVFYSLPLNDKVSVFYFKGMIGLSDATSYGYMAKGNDFSKVQRHKKNDAGLGYAFGLDFRTSILDVEGLSLTGSCNYISSNHNFENVTTSDSRGGEITSSFKQRFQNLSITWDYLLDFNGLLIDSIILPFIQKWLKDVLCDVVNGNSIVSPL